MIRCGFAGLRGFLHRPRWPSLFPTRSVEIEVSLAMGRKNPRKVAKSQGLGQYRAVISDEGSKHDKDQNNCPECGGPVTVNKDGSRACGFTLGEIEFGCGWESPPLFDLAPPPP
jgi:hypothetical protein